MCLCVPVCVCVCAFACACACGGACLPAFVQACCQSACVHKHGTISMTKFRCICNFHCCKRTTLGMQDMESALNCKNELMNKSSTGGPIEAVRECWRVHFLGSRTPVLSLVDHSSHTHTWLAHELIHPLTHAPTHTHTHTHTQGRWGGQALVSFEAAALGNLQPSNAEEVCLFVWYRHIGVVKD